MRDTMVPGTRSRLPAPFAHGYYRYQDGGETKTVDVADQNLSLLAGAGDLISTTGDLHRFFSALNGGKLLPATLLAEMRVPDPEIGYGLGVFVGQSCGGTVLHHNGGPPGGYGTVMYSTPDGSRTVTASVNTGDAAINLSVEFTNAVNRLVTAAFCDGQAG